MVNSAAVAVVKPVVQEATFCLVGSTGKQAYLQLQFFLGATSAPNNY